MKKITLLEIDIAKEICQLQKWMSNESGITFQIKKKRINGKISCR